MYTVKNEKYPLFFHLFIPWVNNMLYGSGHETVAVLLPGFAIKQNQVTRQP